MKENHSKAPSARLRQVWPPLSPRHSRPFDGGNPKLAKVQAAARWHSARSKIFGSTMFDEPGWRIMLQVYTSHLQNSNVTLRSLAESLDDPIRDLASQVAALEAADLLTGSGEEAGATLRLTDQGLGAMHALFEVLPARTLK